ncbi:hypothetical protein HOLleu_01516 [Holothuria leucospilota]|uniref:Uncharacterized protein n=1 Tax=Holothuria leucospilota TaxID=206669 RepID=A0A9Q1CQE8_HOLLE|nr:hypothetical protein HOLleu_01516 [Holothuria leucospilota]
MKVPTEDDAESDFSDTSDINDPEFIPSDVSEENDDDDDDDDDDWDVGDNADVNEDEDEVIKEVPNSEVNTMEDPFVVDSSSKQKHSYCLFCDKPQQKLPRHCRRKHADELLVAEAMAIEGNLQLRRQKWLHIRNLGNHAHNSRIYNSEENCNDLIVRKRPSNVKTIHDYVACSDCVGYFYKNTVDPQENVSTEAKECSSSQSCKGGY